MNELKQVVNFRNVLRRMERVVLSRIRDTSYCCGVTVNQGHILLCLEGDGEHTITALNDELRLDKASLSRTVNSLVEKGLVSRAYRSDDRRRQKLDLTEEGKVFVKRINDASLESFARVFGILDEEVRERISGDLQVLVEAMRSGGGRETACCGEKE